MAIPLDWNRSRSIVSVCLFIEKVKEKGWNCNHFIQFDGLKQYELRIDMNIETK